MHQQKRCPSPKLSFMLIAVRNAALYLSSLPGIGRSVSVRPSAVWHGGKRIRNRWIERSCIQSSASTAAAYSCSTEAARESSAPGAVIWRIDMVGAVIRMIAEKALLCYQVAMHIARQWLSSGLITAEDCEKFDTITVEKFGVSVRSIWRDINLIKLPTDGNMSPAKGGISSRTNHSDCSAHEAG